MESDWWEWRKGLPTKRGWYARTTLWGRVIFEYIDILPDGSLVGFKETGSMVPLAEYDSNLYWLGPIPRPPVDANHLAKLRGEL